MICGLCKGGEKMDIKLDKKIKQLRGTQERAEKYAPKGKDGMEARALRALGEDSKQLADWLEELKRYRDLEEQGRLLVLPCKVGKYEKRLVDLEKAMDKSTLCDWYITSVKQKDTPVWTGEHIEELLNDFYIIPKEAEAERRRCKADGN